MRITPEMLLDALHAGARPGVWLQDRFDSSDEAILIDGWFELAKAAERLNADLDKLMCLEAVRLGFGLQPSGIIDVKTKETP